MSSCADRRRYQLTRSVKPSRRSASATSGCKSSARLGTFLSASIQLVFPDRSLGSNQPILSVSSHQIRRPKRRSTASPRRVFRWTRRTRREPPNLFQNSLRLATFDASCFRKEAGLGSRLECRVLLSQAISRLHNASLPRSDSAGTGRHRPLSEATSAFGHPRS